MINEIAIDSFNQLLVWSRRCRETFGEIWFRGHSDNTWKLAPSVFRKHLDHQYEFNLAQNFMLQSPARCSDTPNLGRYDLWLSLMRHSGLHTRLLDWSESLLVACFFAVGTSNIERDGGIWMVCPTILNQNTDNTNGIHMLYAIRDSKCVKNAFVRRVQSADQIVAAIPTEVSVHMMMQSSRFTVHNSHKPLEEYSSGEQFLQKAVIAPEVKQEIAVHLDIMGVKLSTLFPTLDALAFDCNQDGDRAMLDKEKIDAEGGKGPFN